MERYIFLLTATPDAAMRLLRSASTAFNAHKGILHELGADVCDYYAVAGPYDLIAIVDCRDSASCLAASLVLATAGLTSVPVRVLREADMDLAARRVAAVQSDGTMPPHPTNGDRCRPLTWTA